MADWDESEHPRHPEGAPDSKGGEFRPKGGKAVRDLATLSRSTLLKYARERGLTIPRGHPDDSIRQMIRRFDSGTEPGWIAEVGKRIEAKKAPAKATPGGRVNPKEIKVGDTIVIRRRNSDTSGRLGPEQVEEHVVARIERTSARPSGWQFYDARGKLVKGAASNSKIEIRRGKADKAGEAFNSRKHPEGTRVVWHPEGQEPVYGTVGKMGRFTTIDWEGGKREKIRTGVNHDDIRVVPDEAGGDWAERVSGRVTRTAEARPPPELSSTPTSVLTPGEQARARRLIRRDPQIFATTRKRFGRLSNSGNLSEADAAWLEGVYKRDRVFVEHLAQVAQVELAVRHAAEKAGQTPEEYRASAAAELKRIVAGKPVAVRVRDQEALRDILDGGRFKTQHEGVRRAAGLGTEIAHRRLGEQILGVPADTAPERRPVYGYVAVGGIEPALSAGRQIPGIRQREDQEDVLSAYGQIQVVLKPGVRSRTTITVGDSLDEIAFIRPTPIDDPTADSLGHGRLDWVRRADFTRTGYIEAQVHGGVRAEDIAEVVFADQPAPATTVALERRGITWRILRPDWASRLAG